MLLFLCARSFGLAVLLLMYLGDGA